MNINIQKLQESRNLNEAKVILDQLHANGAVRKLVEVSFMTRNSTDRNTQEYGMSCMREAATTLKDSEQPAIPESPGIKPKGDHFVKEELLDNHSGSSRSAGSEQSTSNTGLPMEGKQDGDEDMQNAPDTENQMKEMGDDNPLDILENTGLHPDIAQKMGANMPQIPPMGSSDQVKQMKYTISEALKPLIRHIKIQDKAIKELSTQIRETKANTLDLPNLKENSIVSFRETTGGMQSDGPAMNMNQQVPNKQFEVNSQRSRMIQLNNALAEQLT